MKKNMSLLDFLKRFGDELNCVLFLEELLWPDSNIQSPYGTKGAYAIRSRHGYYKCKETRRNFSIRHGLIFQDSKLPLTTWFLAVFLLMTAKKSISSLHLSKELGVTQPTAWFMMMRIRSTTENSLFKLPLSGVVEMDEHYSGGKGRGKRGRGASNKTPIFGMVERGGNVRCKVVPDCKAQTLLRHVQENVDPSALVMTDDFKSYKILDRKGYTREVINHSNKHYVRDGWIHTNTIEGFWSHLKLGIKSVHIHVSPKHLQRYCHEYEWKYNTRKITNDVRFSSWLKDCRGGLTYKELTQK